VTGTGSVFPDDSTSLRNYLVPLIGGGLPQSVISAGSGTPKYDFVRVNGTVASQVLYTQNNASALSTVLALYDPDEDDPTLGYTKSREIRATIGSANFSGAVAGTLTWNEYVDTDYNNGDRDDGDYGFIEASPDAGATWYPITNTPTARSQDSSSVPQTAGVWRTRTASISALECAACVDADSVQLAIHWVADNDNKRGHGWLLDDISIATLGFTKTFETPEFDLLVIGSNIDQNALTAEEIKDGIRT
jgi:hypothetical protein